MESKYVVISKTNEEYGAIRVENGLITDELRTKSVQELKEFIGDRKIVEYSMNLSSLSNDFEDVLAMAKERYNLLNNTLGCICDNTGVKENSEDAIDKCKTIYQVYTYMCEHPVKKQENPQPQIVINNENNNVNNNVNPQMMNSPKSWIVTLLLCFFFGGLGIHRFYVGKIGTGILYFLTLGLFGFGAIFDFIMILLGKFTDSYGRVIKQD